MEQSLTGNIATNKVMIGVSPATRFWAWLIDVVSLYLVNSAAGLLLVFLFVGHVNLSETEIRIEWILLFFNFAYYTLSEGLFGASIGKLILGLRVVDLNGNPCSIWAAFVRAVFRFIETLFFGIIALINMQPPLQQRLGDKVAKTVVVKPNGQFPIVRRPVWTFWVIQIGYFFFVMIGLYFRYAFLP